MVFLSGMFDLDEFNQMVSDKMVTVRDHQDGVLAIANYSPECQWLRRWNSVTTQCRGLIFDKETLEVVARPFPKFFNWDESNAPYPPSGPVIRMPKMDGSLGILYPVMINMWNGGSPERFLAEYAISTRGSFESEQAQWATKFLQNKMHDLTFQSASVGSFEDFRPRSDKTYLFEIIYPSNRIVVDYGEYEGLVLIDVIDNESGLPDTDEYDDCGWSDKAPRIPLAGFKDTDAADIPPGDEGFVYLWPTRNFRTKMKSADYVHLHRIISNLNEKTIWQALCDGKDLPEIKKDLPEEFHKFVDDTGHAIMNQALKIVDEAHDDYFHIRHLTDRKEFAIRAVQKPTKQFLFAFYDGKSMRDILGMALRLCKPVRQTNLTAGDDA